MARIVVVDDSQMILDLMQQILEVDGHRVYSFLKPSQMLDWIKNEPAPNLIILDYHMPEITGKQLSESLQKFGLSHETKIILLTTDFVAAGRLFGQNPQTNVCGWLLKPPKVELIRKAVTKALG